MKEVTLYTTHCPMCTVLRKKLDEKKVDYDIVDSVETMQKLGILTVPMISVNFAFGAAVEYINSLEDNSGIH